MVVLFMVQLGIQFLSLLIVWKGVNYPWNCDVSSCAYNIFLNFDQIHATMLSTVYLVLASDVCLRLGQNPHTWCHN